ncbi:MAG: ABC transporter permease subunit [Gammaproteobacteria bacterium]|nr:ABC transporter permease subunit [Gammaproteobacteria bacterium]MCP4924545.1 ABC transporter permease subunit [Gammaproteobacteria bacterium]
MFGEFDTGVIFDNLHFLIQGMQTTLILTVIAIGGGLVLGTLLALARLAPFKLLSFIAGTYVNFFRSMPLILVIFWFYFLVPHVVHRLKKVTSWWSAAPRVPVSQP